MSGLPVFIHRPVATSLLLLAVALAGVLALVRLPVASLPQVDLPTIGVSASLPGANPEVMAATVAMPLERAFGQIAGITEMTSTSTQGSTRINLQFELGRDIDGAARDVQAAINAARALLPSSLPGNPTYRKANSVGPPVLAIALTSGTHTQDQLYDVAFSLIGQKIAQVRGVGQVNVNGSALRAVRIEVDPLALRHHGIGLEQVRTAIAAANSHLPRGLLEDGGRRWQIEVNAPGRQARDFRDLVIAAGPGGVLRLADVATVSDSVQDLRIGGTSGGRPAVILAVNQQPGANVVDTVDAVKALLPGLREIIPSGIDVEVVIDRSTTIRKSLREIGETLAIAVALVVLVTYVFLGSGRATVIPCIVIPVTLLGTLAVIHLLGYSLNNLSLMALIVATCFVVDDAIVVVEYVGRHIEAGLAPLQAALRGIGEVGFTLVAMCLALVAVFIPLLLMGGLIGRMFREFAITLVAAVGISTVVSLVATPMLCSRWLRPSGPRRARRDWLAAPEAAYARSLAFALRHRHAVLALLAGVIAFNVYLYAAVPKGFFPEQDTGRLNGFFRADQSVSFQHMRQKVGELMAIVAADPDVETSYEYTGGSGGGQVNAGSMFARLKPLPGRSATAAEVVARLRPKLAQVAGATLFLNAQQELNIGARQGGAQYQFTLLADELAPLRQLAPHLRNALAQLPELTDVNSDFQDGGLLTRLEVDREAAARLGITARQIDSALNDAFGQRLVATLFEPLNQYYLVLSVAPMHAAGPQALENIHLAGSGPARVPLSAIARWEADRTPLAVNHQGTFAAATVSFNLAPGVSLDRATAAIEAAFERLQPPDGVSGRFAGTARIFQESMESQPWLILAAILAVYIVLGMLYESTALPLVILSTLPSAGVGALLALLACGSPFTLIAFIGVTLLVGLVMKNAIMMVDTALQRERLLGLSPEQAILQSCRQRFRPIVMTSIAAILGALPLALGAGDGAELRRPLGISIVGGLVFSQLLTLYTTPVVYLHLDRLRHQAVARWRRGRGQTSMRQP